MIVAAEHALRRAARASRAQNPDTRQPRTATGICPD
jgi:hypothetical protein